jgi:hypothetical protein
MECTAPIYPSLKPSRGRLTGNAEMTRSLRPVQIPYCEDQLDCKRHEQPCGMHEHCPVSEWSVRLRTGWMASGAMARDR